MATPQRAALALLLVSLAGCGVPGRAPEAAAVAKGEAALAAGRLDEAEALLVHAEKAVVGPGLDSSLRRRALRALVATRLQTGRFGPAQEAFFQLRGLGERGPTLARQGARLALVTGLDLARAREGLQAEATDAEDEAMLARLDLRLGRPAVSGLAPATGDQGRLLAIERGLPDPAPAESPSTPELAAELLAQQLDAGSPPADLAARLASLSWPARAAWLRERRDWLAGAPEDPRPDLFRTLRRGGPGAPDVRLELLAAVRGPTWLPTSPRLAVSRQGGQLVDRDPISPRRRADDRSRVLVAIWPGLSTHYLRASLEAGHFPYLKAWVTRGAFLTLPAGSPPARPEAAATLAGAPPPDRPEVRRRRLFPDGLPEPAPAGAVEELLAFDRALAVHTLVAAAHHEEHRPALLWMELPTLDAVRPWLLPLLVDCPPPEPLARRIADEVGGFGGTLDRLVRRLEVWAGRMVPLLDRDDHVLVLSPHGQPGEGGFLVAMGPGFRADAPARVDFPPERLGEVAAWLAAGRLGSPPAGTEAFLRPRPQSPFQH